MSGYKIIQEVRLSFEVCVVNPHKVDTSLVAAKFSNPYCREIRTYFDPEIFILALLIQRQKIPFFCLVVTKLQFGSWSWHK
jgi:hypothetical protein